MNREPLAVRRFCSPPLIVRGSSDIGTRLQPAATGFAHIADQLADACAEQDALRQGAHGPDSQLSALLDALGRVRRVQRLSDVLNRAGRELCAAQIFDRVMVSKVDGSMWFPSTLYRLDEQGGVVLEIDDPPIDGMAIALTSPLVEAEVVRRRQPALVQDAQNEPRAHRGLTERFGADDYAAAPVIAGNAVVGLLHVDTVVTKRPLSAMDRDLLRMFADGVGLVVDRVGLADQLERQRRAVIEACQAATQSLDGLERPAAPIFTTEAAAVRDTDGVVQFAVRRPVELPAGRGQSRLSRLTAREREVLALLAGGMTNAQLAHQLTVAESTVKSHVKHILHKLGAGNRAAAIACYLREARVDERRMR